jgi:hypothetical protein
VGDFHLQGKKLLCKKPENPTDGSRWIVQILSTKTSKNTCILIPPTVVGGYFKFDLSKDLNNPPTAVGGIQN